MEVVAHVGLQDWPIFCPSHLFHGFFSTRTMLPTLPFPGDSSRFSPCYLLSFLPQFVGVLPSRIEPRQIPGCYTLSFLWEFVLQARVAQTPGKILVVVAYAFCARLWAEVVTAKQAEKSKKGKKIKKYMLEVGRCDEWKCEQRVGIRNRKLQYR